MDKKIYEQGFTQNRDLSWLQFNERVLQEAMDKSVPLLERLKFISIFCSNLDEFFMIRVGSIFQLMQLPESRIDYRSGLSNEQQISKIYEEVKILYAELNLAYKQVKKELASKGIKELKYNQLRKNEKSFIHYYFKETIFPIVSPQIIDRSHPFPFIASKEAVLFTRMKRKQKEICGLVSIPDSLPPILLLPGDEIRYILMEDIFIHYIDRIFKPYETIEKVKLCVTRNADISPDDEDFELTHDFRKTMQQMLKKRKKLNIVRVEISAKLTKGLEKLLNQYLNVTADKIFVNKSPMKMGYGFYLLNKLPENIVSQNTYTKHVPVYTDKLNPEISLFEQIKKKDILLHYPYQSMKPFLDLLKEASEDKNVVSIHITIYRLSRRSRLIEYLCRAAENGIQVTVLIELRARFDEQNNINWSQALEEAGCRILYGFEEFKVHSKICLITRKESDGINFYTQIGTGNFNESTAKLYTDLQLLTNDSIIGNDADDFFKNMLLENLEFNYKNLIVSPDTLKQTVIKLIDEEAAKKENGYIFIKINSLTDIEIIEHLKNASKNNATIVMIIRGICCLIPQVKGQTENIRVFSIVGQFLEHSRVYMFGQGKDKKIYISSADFMTRNTERRVEVAVEITDPLIKRDINTTMSMILKDNRKIREILSDGKYHKIESNEPSFISQVQLINRYNRLSKKEKEAQDDKGIQSK